MPLRIAHFVQRYPPALGGSELYFQRLSRHLAAARHQVTVWTTDALDLEAFWSRRGHTMAQGDETDHGVAVRRFHCLRWPLRRYLLKALSFAPGSTWRALTMPCNPICPRMWREAGQTDDCYDVVHATAFPYAWPIVCARRLARRCGAAFFITPFLHLGDPDAVDHTRRSYLAPHLQELLRGADGVFVQTPLEQSAVRAIGVEDSRIILQGMGVDPSECTGGNRAGARASWGVAPGQVVVGHLANLSEEKGTVDLLRAAQIAWERRADFHVVLAGPDMLNFRRYWESFPQRDRVTLLGVLDDQQRRDFFAGIDIFALPSRSDSFGLVLLEAWANGVPNIAYRCGGVADLIRHRRDGMLIRLGEKAIEHFAGALIRLASDSDLRSALGTAGRGRVAVEFRWPDKLGIVEEAYARSARPRQARALSEIISPESP